MVNNEAPPFEWLTRFKPKFDSLDKDCDRVDDLIVELSDAGKITIARGQSLYSAYCVDCHRWLEAKYFEHRLFDAIESYYTSSDEQPISWPYPSELEAAEKFIALGEKTRARRLWRNHLALVKDTYWHLISYRDRGFKRLKIVGEAESEQRQQYEDYVAQIPEKKALLLDILNGARDFFIRADASEAELKRLARDIADVKAEQRTRPKGKPDAREMSEGLFWEIIEGDSQATIGERIEQLPERLAAFKPKAIKDFNKLLRTRWNEAYRTDVWALAYLLRGGCSDDAFMDFRAWLIMQGRQVFEQALSDPDGFDIAWFSADAPGCISIMDAPAAAHEMRAGKAMPQQKFKPAELKGPNCDEEQLATLLPRIAAATK